MQFIHNALLLAIEVSKVSGPKLVDFKKVLEDDVSFHSKALEIKTEVENFAIQFPMPGYDF